MSRRMKDDVLEQEQEEKKRKDRFGIRWLTDLTDSLIH